jgi:flagellar biosynthesis protein FlhB
MSSASERPFEATPRRIAKAKREGNVARSSELAANLSFAAGGLTVLGLAPALGAVAGSAFIASASGAALGADASIVGLALVPVSAAGIAGTLGNFLQNGFVVLGVTPKFERLNPVEGIKRIASRETLGHSLRASLAFVCASAAMAPFIGWGASALLRADTLAVAAGAAWTAAREVSIAAVVVGLGFAVFEYGAARGAWLRKLAMSFEERKREAKEEEGDAAARGRRRALHRALLRGGFGRVKDAAFVVANPQHVAVALEFRPPRVPVPRVLVRAADAAAIRLRAIAASCRIPIVENVELARALYRDGRPGEAIPHAHYMAVAEVVVALQRVNALREP